MIFNFHYNKSPIAYVRVINDASADEIVYQTYFTVYCTVY